MKSTLTLIALIISLSISLASPDHPIGWNKLSIDLNSGQKLIIAGHHKLIKLTLIDKDLTTAIDIPKSELNDILSPQLKTTQASFGHFWRMNKNDELRRYTAIKLHFGQADKHGQFATVSYLFSKGKLIHRSEDIPHR